MVPLDIGFIVDSSGSLRNEYEKEKEFVQGMVAQLSKSQPQLRAALVLFSLTADLEIKFSEYKGKDDFNKKVGKLPLFGSTTRIDRALNVAHREMFNVQNGMRPNVTKVLVLMTDGKQTEMSDAIRPSIAAEPFHRDGIKVITIGIGPAIDPVELEGLVKRPEYLYFAKDFNELKTTSFIAGISDASCEIPGEYGTAVEFQSKTNESGWKNFCLKNTKYYNVKLYDMLRNVN